VTLNRWNAVLLVGLCLYFAAAPIGAQTVRAQASAGVDLQARLQEVEHNPKLANTILKTGRNVAAFCANCHGEGGNSLKPDVPNLAGQNPAYLIEQLRQFADGRRRNEFMEGLIKALSADEKIGIVLFFAGQMVTPQSSSNAALAARGKDYFSKVCKNCHGEDGRGNEMFARIAGQPPDYLRITLKHYRAGTGQRVNPLMAASTKPMTDADIDAVVEFVTSMQ
jgi:cytochrome c553